MRIFRRRKRVEGDRGGAAMVETALVLPIFFMVVLAVIEFGRAMMVAQLLTNGAREGARMAVLPGATNSSVQSAVTSFVSAAAGVPSNKLTVTITVTPAAGNANPNNDVALSQKRDLCDIKVSVAFSDVDYIPGKYLAGSNLVGQCAMRKE